MNRRRTGAFLVVVLIGFSISIAARFGNLNSVGTPSQASLIVSAWIVKLDPSRLILMTA